MKFFTLCIALFLAQQSFSQNYFEGTVTYEYQYQSLYKFITTEYIKKTFPSGEIKTYKGSKLVIQTFFPEKTDTLKTIYVLDEQVGYVINPASDTIKQFSFNTIPGELLKSEKIGLTKEVLGKNCPAVQLEYIAELYKGKKINAVYYYDPAFPLNADLYQNFKQGYLNLYTEMAQSIVLASTMSYENLYRVDGTATKIDKKDIQDSFFDLPKDKVIIPMK